MRKYGRNCNYRESEMKLMPLSHLLLPSLLACVFLELFDVAGMCEGVDREVDGEGRDTEGEAWDKVANHEAVRKDRVFSPGFTLRPRISVKRRHGETIS